MVIFTVLRWVFMATSTPVMVPCTWHEIIQICFTIQFSVPNLSILLAWIPIIIMRQKHTVQVSSQKLLKPLSQREKALWFYLSSILHLDSDSLVRELHQEPHQLHDDWDLKLHKFYLKLENLDLVIFPGEKTNHKGEDFGFLCGGGIGNRLERCGGWMPR